MPDIEKLIAIQRRKIVEMLLPDFCRIYPSVGENAVISDGIMTYETPLPRVWHNFAGLDQSDIPCRITIERAFVPDKLYSQVVVVSRYTLDLPANMRGIVEQSDHIIKDGRKYEIRKVSDQSEFDGTLELTVVEITVDNP